MSAESLSRFLDMEKGNIVLYKLKGKEDDYMGLISMLRIDIDAGVEVYQMTKNAVLIDVRTKEEYDQGHIPNSINLPLSELDQILREVPDKNTPLFVYCQSGSRSARAVKSMKKAGYVDVTNIGGILYYHGSVEK